MGNILKNTVECTCEEFVAGDRRQTEEAVSRRAEVDVQDDRPREVDAREGDVLVPAGERGFL